MAKNKDNKDIKVIVLDLDGTLLTSKHVLTDKSADALKAAIAQGIQVILATGKTRNSATSVYKRLGIQTPGIFVQGLALSYPDGTEKHLGTLDPDLLRRVITFIEDRGFQVIAYSGHRVVMRHVTSEAIEITEVYEEPRPEAVGPLQNIVDELPINKLMLFGGPASQITHLRWQLGHMIGGAARMTQALAEALELLPYGASKGTALKVLMKELKIDPDTVMALGDGENDVEMIESVGLGLAVGNAHPKLKAVAKDVVASNDEDGVAEAVEKYVLKKQKAAPPVPADAPAAKAAPEAATEAKAEPS